MWLIRNSEGHYFLGFSIATRTEIWDADQALVITDSELLRDVIASLGSTNFSVHRYVLSGGQQ